jgi:type II restriction enzyme
MPKLEDARKILEGFGLPPGQCNEIAAYTLLALGGIKKRSRWSDAKNDSIRIHDILQWVAVNYRRRYAENTRETIRRRVLHQLNQAHIVDLNPDEPGLPTNSPRTHYALTSDALAVVKVFRTPAYRKQLKAFRQEHRPLLEIHAKKRGRPTVPVRLPSGRKLMMSPGRHNELQRQVIEGFAPKFAAGALVLYFGDTAKKHLYIEERALTDLGFPMTEHDKLPDIVLYSNKRHALYLIEVVTSHGPVSHKRHFELEKLLAKCKAKRLYISAFPDFREFKRHIQDIAWETEVWIAEIPDHLIHFNGDKFLEQ